MSGLRKTLNALKKTQKSEKNLWNRMSNPTVPEGWTVFPKGQPQQAKVGFRWDRDVRIVQEDGTVVNRFKLQANAQAESASIQEYIRKQGKKGTHAVITSVDIPEGAEEEDVMERVENAIDKVN
jgi:hypothetical protein